MEAGVEVTSREGVVRDETGGMRSDCFWAQGFFLGQ